MDTNIEIFIALTDGLFWDGYTEQLAKDDPALYSYQYKEFMSAYA